MLLKRLNLTFNHERPSGEPTGRVARITFLSSNTKINKSIGRFQKLFVFFVVVSHVSRSNKTPIPHRKHRQIDFPDVTGDQRPGWV